MKAAVVEAAIPNMGLTFKAPRTPGENWIHSITCSTTLTLDDRRKTPPRQVMTMRVRRPSGPRAPWAWACCWVSGSWPRSVSPLVLPPFHKS